MAKPLDLDDLIPNIVLANAYKDVLDDISPACRRHVEHKFQHKGRTYVMLSSEETRRDHPEDPSDFWPASTSPAESHNLWARVSCIDHCETENKAAMLAISMLVSGKVDGQKYQLQYKGVDVHDFGLLNVSVKDEALLSVVYEWDMKTPTSKWKRVDQSHRHAVCYFRIGNFENTADYEDMLILDLTSIQFGLLDTVDVAGQPVPLFFCTWAGANTECPDIYREPFIQYDMEGLSDLVNRMDEIIESEMGKEPTPSDNPYKRTSQQQMVSLSQNVKKLKDMWATPAPESQ